jgi:hypothetical protein
MPELSRVSPCPTKNPEVLVLPSGWGTATIGVRSSSTVGMSRSYGGGSMVLNWDGGDFAHQGLHYACDIENRRHCVDWIAAKLGVSESYFGQFWTSCEVVAKLIDMPIVQLLKDPEVPSFKMFCSEKHDLQVVFAGAELKLKRLISGDVDATCCFGVRVQ